MINYYYRVALLFGVSLLVALNAQSQATNGTAANNAYNSTWYLGWNNSNGSNPLLFKTNAINRMKLNGIINYNINGYAGNRDGYLLIGFPGNSMASGQPIYSSTGAYSLLHLNGRTNSVQEYGYRPWMQTGVTFTDNADLAYVGLRQLGTVDDLTEMAFAWSDNTTGPDKMVFRFMGYGGSDGATASANLVSNTDLDGLHIAQFMPTGLMGLGNTFGTDVNVGTYYIEPKSLFHQSYTHRSGSGFDPFGFMQITYRGSGYRGVGETANDGLRFGIDNTIVNGGLNAYLRWQEGTPFVVQTDWDDVAGVLGERFRVAATGMPGTPNVYGNTPNVTRISVPWRGDLPVDSAKALLHLGYNANSGWAPWMDYGTLVANSKSTLFTGFTNTAYVDGFQAAIGYGRSHLLFIDKELGEVARFDDNTGNFGIGNFGTDGLNVAPTEKLDVNGNARFRNIPAAGGQSIILGLQPGTNPNDVKLSRLAFPADPSLFLAGDGTWQPMGGTGTPGTVTGAHNGTSPSILDPTKVAFGQNLGGTGGQLLNNREVPMNDFNIVFTDVNNTYNGLTNRIGIGTSTPLAKLDILMDPTNNGLPAPIGLSVNNYQSSSAISNGVSTGQQIGVFGNNYNNRGLDISVKAGNAASQGALMIVSGASTTNSTHVGLSAASQATGFPTNTGVSGTATNGRSNTGGGFLAIGIAGTNANRGVFARVSGTATNENTGVYAEVSGPGTTNYGFRSQINANTGQSIGVFSSLNNSNGPGNRAGLFHGILESSVPGVVTSDSIFKTNVNSLSGSLKLLGDINPVSYYMDTTAYAQFNFTNTEQFGFIAQQLEDVFPNLVHESLFPAQYDSLGTEISPALPYKSVNYTALIPVNSAAINELNKKVDNSSLSDQSIKTHVADLQGSLAKVIAMRGVNFDWTASAQPQLGLDSNRHVGFIAQEMHDIVPLVTFMDEDGLMHVDYEKVVPILAEAIEELNETVESKDSIISAQQAQLDNVNDRLSQLENCLSGVLPFLCQMSQAMVETNDPAEQEKLRSEITVKLTDKPAIILDQNVPNPFAEQTVINFSIPETVGKAQIHFYNGEGKLMESVEVAERGLGSITVYGSDLSTGVYTYTLVADGQIVATKKMMKN